MNTTIERDEELDLLTKALGREREARLRAEELLEDKSRMLYAAQERLQVQFDRLRRHTAEVELLSSATYMAQTCDDFSEIMRRFLTAVCTACGWPIGHVLVPEQDEIAKLISLKVWHVGESGVFDGFREATETLEFTAGVGLPGKVMISRMPVWIEDLQRDASSPRSKSMECCESAGEVRAALGVPITVYEEIVAVAEFFSPEPLQADPHLLALVESAARQLGTVLERRRAEEQVRKNYEELQQAHLQLKATQTQLIQSEKLASLGQLAAGVAHEINNPIGFVKSNLGTLREYCEVYRECVALARGFAEECRDLSGICEQHVRELIERLDDVETREELSLLVEDTFDLLEESRSGVVRVQDIVQNLKCFARLDEAEFKVASIHEIIESTLKVVWNELKYKCEVDKRFGEVPPTLCNPGQLNQVFMNLLINAAQAIEERGHVVIATDVFEEKIRCRISDDGIGIPEEHLKDLFTPFFTTKPVGMGTGLGLSISYGIIKDHGGSIDVQSEVGKGTTFTILLPIQHAETSR